jgi:hypothetical protein
MSGVYILRSRHLISKEGKPDLPSGYQYSHHGEAFNEYKNALDSFQISPELMEDTDLQCTTEMKLIAKNSTIIVPEIRVCTNATYQKLVEFSEHGGIVFAGVPSYYYDLEPNTEIPTRQMEERFRFLFQLKDSDTILSRNVPEADLVFLADRFNWITNNFPSKIKYKGKNQFALLINGQSKTLKTHGDMHFIKLLDNETSISDDENQKKNYPAFIIREYSNGGLFIFACFSLRKFIYYKELLKNIAEYRPTPKYKVNQLRILKILIVFLFAIIGLFISKEMLGGNWQNYLGGIILGVILGVIGNKLTDYADKWVKNK